MFNFGENQIVGLLMKCLMVAGGYAAGYVLTMLAGIGFDKLVTHRKSPEVLHKTARILGGLIAAILVALLVFGGFGGGGSGDGKGDGQGNKRENTGGTGASVTDPNATKPTDPIKPEASVTVEAVRVKVLAGEEVEKNSEKFYRLDDRPTSVDRAAVLAAIGDRKKAAKGSVVVVYEFGREAGPKTIAFTELEAAAKELGVQLMSDEQYRRFTKR